MGDTVTDRHEPRFFCDVMLGGLARWLRAAGYDAAWEEHIDDGDLVRRAADEGRVLLSSDIGVFKRGIVRDGEVPALLIPVGLGKQEQLAFVLRELSLPLREPRCMACGGALAEADKERARGRVPARTWAWLDRFYECTRCGRVFWRGTHWRQIAERLGQAGQEG